MRILVGLLLAVALVLQLLLGASLVYSAQYQGTGGLSDVSADLVNEDQLQQMKQQEDPYRAQRKALGIALGVLGLLQIVSCVLAIKRRGRVLVMAGSGLSALAAALVMVVHRPLMLAGILIGLLVLALVLSVLSRPASDT